MRLLTFLFCTVLYSQTDLVTNRYNQFSQGANTHEGRLNASNVNVQSFGKLYSYYVDGAAYAQPLFVHGVNINNAGQKNVLYVATMNDKLYAHSCPN